MIFFRELPPAHLPGIGRSDLDPFAPPGGGMIFNPFGPRRDIENPGLGIPGGLPRWDIWHLQAFLPKIRGWVKSKKMRDQFSDHVW